MEHRPSANTVLDLQEIGRHAVIPGRVRAKVEQKLKRCSDKARRKSSLTDEKCRQSAADV